MLFLIPSSLVNNIVNERSARQQNTIAEVSASWGRPQTLVGPILVVPYNKRVAADKPLETEYAYFLPDTLAASGRVDVEIRSRDIYDVPVYASVLDFEGSFSAPDINGLGLDPQDMRYSESFVVFGLPDLRGVREQIEMQWNTSKVSFSPGVKGFAVSSGVSAPVSLALSGQPQIPVPTRYAFSVKFDLRGSQALAFMPIGKETKVKLVSNWAYPSFDGAFLPTTHTITDSGFEAEWTVLDLNRAFPQKWTDKESYGFGFSGGEAIAYPKTDFDGRFFEPVYPTMEGKGGQVIDDAFGVRLLQPVDLYQKTQRSAKYGIAVIALVFVVIFFTELTARRRIHPVQYALVGFALVVFYTLLLSLAEYIRFGWAYLVASAAVIGMVTLFSKSIMESWKRALMGGGVLTLFYGFVYVLLQLTDYALLLGSIALFVILGAIMWVSRRIDWYGIGQGD